MTTDWNFLLWYVMASIGLDGFLSILAGLMKIKKSDVVYFGTFSAVTGLIKMIIFILLLIVTIGGK
jgi:hypothetical protein